MIPKTRLPADARLDTLAVREGLPPSQWGENSEALYLTSSFVHPDAATAAARFANEEEAFVYSRFSNPTVTMMERRLAALEGSEAAIGTASGMSREPTWGRLHMLGGTQRGAWGALHRPPTPHRCRPQRTQLAAGVAERGSHGRTVRGAPCQRHLATVLAGEGLRQDIGCV